MSFMRQEPQDASAQGAQDKSLFFRDTDSALCESFCERIVNDGLSLSIVGANAAIVDHCCSMIVRGLRRYPDIRLEVHSPTNTEALLSSFNKVLESISTAEATGGRTPSAPLRILIASDAHDINPVHARLLARLVSNFPGANTQLIALQTDESSDSPLSILGARLLHWKVPMPSREEASKMLEAARSNGLELEATKLLNKVNPKLLLEESSQTPSLSAINVIEATQPERPIVRGADIDIDIDVDAGGEQKTKPSAERRAPSAFLLWAFMVIVAAAVVAPLFPQQTGVIRDALLGLGEIQEAPQLSSSAREAGLRPVARDLEATQRMSDNVVDTTPPPANSDAAKAMPETGRGQTESDTTSTKSESVSPLPADAKGAAPLAPPPVQRAPGVDRLPPIVMNEATGTLRFSRDAEAPAQPGKAASRVVGQALPEKPAVIRADKPSIKPAPIRPDASPLAIKPQAGKDIDDAVRKIRSAQRQNVFVQHVALDSYADARDWKLANSALSAALVVPVKARPLGTIKYSVVSGPFPTRTQAVAFAQSKGVPTEHWLRSAESLVNALATTN